MTDKIRVSDDNNEDKNGGGSSPNSSIQQDEVQQVDFDLEAEFIDENSPKHKHKLECKDLQQELIIPAGGLRLKLTQTGQDDY